MYNIHKGIVYAVMDDGIEVQLQTAHPDLNGDDTITVKHSLDCWHGVQECDEVFVLMLNSHRYREGHQPVLLGIVHDALGRREKVVN